MKVRNWSIFKIETLNKNSNKALSFFFNLLIPSGSKKVTHT